MLYEYTVTYLDDDAQRQTIVIEAVDANHASSEACDEYELGPAQIISIVQGEFMHF